ncbi:MAG: hypothetical protein V4655_08190, partial [Bdellovibrionota bacterium]
SRPPKVKRNGAGKASAPAALSNIEKSITHTNDKFVLVNLQLSSQSHDPPALHDPRKKDYSKQPNLTPIKDKFLI